MGRNDYDFGGQICFLVDLREPSGRRRRTIAMIADHDDGGAFHFSREYPTFADCTAQFWRG